MSSQPPLTPLIYLDYAAATPLLPEAYEAMAPWLTTEYANPSAIHSGGVRARAAIEAVRQQIARVLAVRTTEVTFTSGGTESNNLAIKGYLQSLHASGRAYTTMEVLTTATEHPSVTETLAEVSTWGVRVVTVPVDGDGIIPLAAFKDELTDQTVLCVLAYVNSEVGTIQPIRSIRRVLDERYRGVTRPMLLVDGAQAPLWLPCQLTTLGADAVTFDAGKFCGPKGVGVLVMRSIMVIRPVMGGGGQEQGIRPGTENVAGIVGAGVALEWAQAGYVERADTVRMVRDEGLAYCLRQLPLCVVNGATDERRVANNLNISLPSVDTEYAVVVLDAHGIAASTKSACAGAGGGRSEVVFAMTGDYARSAATLRLTLGPDVTRDDLVRTTEVLRRHCMQMAVLRQDNY